MWTNWISPSDLQNALPTTYEVRHLRDVLDIGYDSQIVYKTDSFKWTVNVRHEERTTLPQFSPFTDNQDYKYVHPNVGAGMVKSPAGRWEVPSTWCKERCMGIIPGDSAAHSTTEKQRHQVIGRMMDENLVKFLARLLATVHTPRWYLPLTLGGGNKNQKLTFNSFSKIPALHYHYCFTKFTSYLTFVNNLCSMLQLHFQKYRQLGIFQLLTATPVLQLVTVILITLPSFVDYPDVNA